MSMASRKLRLRQSTPAVGAVVICFALATILLSSRADESDSDANGAPGADAARALLKSLPQAKRTQAQLPFESAERTDWNYVPMRRAGVPLADLDANQQGLVDPLLQSALSPEGFRTARAIVAHESILAQ